MSHISTIFINYKNNIKIQRNDNLKKGRKKYDDQIIKVKYFNNFKKLYNFYKLKILMGIGDWGLGIGDWGLGIGDWGLGPVPNSQSPIPNKFFFSLCYIYFIKLYLIYYLYFYKTSI